MAVNVHVFETPDEQAEGLQHLDRIDPGMLYVFPSAPEGVEFHSMNVPEPFDIAFMNDDYRVLALIRMIPMADRIKAPAGSTMAVEARAGNLSRWGFLPGNVMSPIARA
jgi:uncharacterized membrane protein (UPF0127 family)